VKATIRPNGELPTMNNRSIVIQSTHISAAIAKQHQRRISVTKQMTELAS